MGIKHLNRFLMDNCTNKSIKKQSIEFLRNKTIVIDTSIYLYKYSVNNMLIENMYLLVSILLKYEILPIFVFDGKSPPEKQELLLQRCAEKNEAEQKYNLLRERADSVSTETDKKELLEEMELLKKKFVRIKQSNIVKVKNLLTAYGIPHVDAPGESDVLCVNMVKKGKAWACLSDDMDMFVYGCPRVLRYISLQNHSVVFYDTGNILTELNMSMKLFREIMVLSGTDYNIHDKTSLNQTINWLYEYNRFCCDTSNKKQSFYQWLNTNTNYIQDYDHLMKTYQIFVETADLPESIANLSFEKKTTNFEELYKILGEYGFICPGLNNR